MSYTTTFDASKKCHAGNRSGTVKFFEHVGRDADDREEYRRRHSNKNIDAGRTAHNITVVNDGSGGYRELRSVDGRPPSREWLDYLDSRLATVDTGVKADGSKKSMRKDAVTMRPVILQPDAEWFAEHNPDWEGAGLNDQSVELFDAMRSWAEDKFGQKNIVGYSIHLDETSPQMHLFFTPIDPNGRLNQKYYFPNKVDLKKKHQELREYLEREVGYDARREVSERSTERWSGEEFGRKCDELREGLASLAEQQAELDDRERAAEIAEQEVAERSDTLNLRAQFVERGEERLKVEREAFDEEKKFWTPERVTRLEEREASVKFNEELNDERETSLDGWERSLERRGDTLDERSRKFTEREADVERREVEVLSREVELNNQHIKNSNRRRELDRYERELESREAEVRERENAVAASESRAYEDAYNHAQDQITQMNRDEFKKYFTDNSTYVLSVAAGRRKVVDGRTWREVLEDDAYRAHVDGHHDHRNKETFKREMSKTFADVKRERQLRRDVRQRQQTRQRDTGGYDFGL